MRFPSSSCINREIKVAWRVKKCHELFFAAHLSPSIIKVRSPPRSLQCDLSVAYRTTMISRLMQPIEEGGKPHNLNSLVKSHYTRESLYNCKVPTSHYNFNQKNAISLLSSRSSKIILILLVRKHV